MPTRFRRLLQTRLIGLLGLLLSCTLAQVGTILPGIATLGWGRLTLKNLTLRDGRQLGGMSGDGGCGTDADVTRSPDQACLTHREPAVGTGSHSNYALAAIEAVAFRSPPGVILL